MPDITEARHGRPTPRRRTRPHPARRLIAAGAATITLLLAGHAAAATRTTTAAADAATRREQATPLPPAGGGGAEATTGMGGTMLRLGLGMLVVVGLILVVWYGMKRFQRGRLPAAGGPAATLVEVVSTTPLGPTRFLHLVRVGDELILVGATDQSVSAVARIGGEEALGMMGAELPPEVAAGVRRAPGPDGRARAATTAAHASLVDRLRAMTARR